MKCIDPKMKKLVSLYHFNLLQEEQKISVEAHLLECDACFQETYQLSPAIENMQEIPECFNDALQPRTIPSIQFGKFLKKVGDIMKKEINSIYLSALELWEKPTFKILLPVAVVAIFFFCLLYFPGSMPDSKHGVKDSASNLSLKLRGMVDGFGTTETLLNQGIKDYQEKHYKEAIPSLNAYVQRKKNDPYGHFYLGVSLILTEEYKKGINHLITARSLCQKQEKELLLEKCHWYLGSAYQKTNDLDKALSELYKVVEIGGDFAEQARNQITSINEQKNK